MDKLVIVTRRFTKEFTIPDKEISIGRSLENTLCLNDETISRFHAKIIKKDDQYYLIDLNSYNGSIVGDHKITPGEEYPLSHNDKITIGDYQLICKFGLDEEESEGDSGDSLSDEFDLDLDSITGDEDQPSPPEEVPNNRKTIRTKAFDEDQATSESMPFDNPNPFGQSPDDQNGEALESHNRATRQIPAFKESQAGEIEAPPDDIFGDIDDDFDSASDDSEEKEEIASYNAKLLVEEEEGQTEYSITKKVTTVGRGKENDIVLPHFSVSKFHGEIRFEKGEFVVRDKNSTNGTMVNDSLIKRCVLYHQTPINFGQINCVFHCPAFPAIAVGQDSEYTEEEVAWMLAEFQVLSKHQIKSAMKESKGGEKSLKQILLSKGLVNPIQWAEAKEALKAQGGLPSNNLKYILLGALSLVLVLCIGLFIWLIISTANPEEGSGLYEEALKDFEAQRYQTVVDKTLTSLSQIEDKKLRKRLLHLHLRARYRLGKEYLKKDSPHKALDQWKKVIWQLSPEDELYAKAAEDSIWYYIDQARKMGQKGQLEKQLQYYDKGLEFGKELAAPPRSYQELIRNGAQSFLKGGEKALEDKSWLKAQNRLERVLDLKEKHQKSLSGLEKTWNRAEGALLLVKSLRVLYNSASSSQAQEQARKLLEKFFQKNSQLNLYPDSHPLYKMAAQKR